MQDLEDEDFLKDEDNLEDGDNFKDENNLEDEDNLEDEVMSITKHSCMFQLGLLLKQDPRRSKKHLMD